MGVSFIYNVNIKYSEIKPVIKMVFLLSYSTVQYFILSLLDIQNGRRNPKHAKNKNGQNVFIPMPMWEQEKI